MTGRRVTEQDGSRFGGIELGGTKTIAVLAQDDTIIARETIPTTLPAETLAAAHEQLARWHAQARLDGVGIASFGPIRLDRAAPDFGHMLPTPKPGWAHADVAGRLMRGIDCPWTIDTDVNGAALAEYRWGGGVGLDSLCYITIGTGIGGGLLIGGRPVHGAMHPEIGHVRTRRVAGDMFAGTCPFHGDCLEGLVSGPALAARFGRPMDEVDDDDPLWAHVVADLAEICAMLLLTTAAQAILFGGGVAVGRAFLFPRVRARTLDLLGDYLPAVDARSAATMIAPAHLGDRAGILGSIALAQDAARRQR